jgi:hypothetical protein
LFDEVVTIASRNPVCWNVIVKSARLVEGPASVAMPATIAAIINRRNMVGVLLGERDPFEVRWAKLPERCIPERSSILNRHVQVLPGSESDVGHLSRCHVMEPEVGIPVGSLP